jgi:large subunit ribosomal protein L25
VESIALTLESRELAKLISTVAGENVLVDLKIENGKKTENHMAMIKEIQVDPLGQEILHVDFYAISMDKKISLEVPIAITGVPVGVTDGGILQQVLRSIEISCLPGRIPEALELDVTSLAVGDSLHVSDLQVSEDIEITADEHLTVVNVVPPIKAEEVTLEFPEEGEEVEEEEAAETKEEGEGD